MDLEDKVDLTRYVTTGIYAQTVIDTGSDNKTLKYDLRMGRVTKIEYREKKKELDDLYNQYVCKLSTKILNMILEVHKAGGIKRSQRTLDAITGELLEREIYEREAKEIK